ncbi:hypothetical protein DH2020_045889 [Rehmannia glutinosa]|uniref:BHLH domain-containing protein n=1 Tax=Rehmannia glutinosa TaxID=99300 RepID=A0ABR0UD03_REHGL
MLDGISWKLSWINCLLALDGFYRELSNQQPSSSSGTLATRLFHVYKESVNYVDTGRIPGFAFKNNLPYMELKLHDLQRMASNEVQLQFYQEAGIKTVVFMGCATGEIELGMSNDPQVDLELEMKKLFPVDFSRQPLPDPTHPPSSSSSSLRSLSVDSPPEYSPLLFNINSIIQEPLQESIIGSDQTLLTSSVSAPIITTTTSPQQQALSQIRNIQFPTIEIENAEMTKAILAVLSSNSPNSTSSTCHQQTADQNLPPIISHINPSAFKRYRKDLGRPVGADIRRKQNMFKKSVLFYRNLNMRRRNEFQVQGNRPSTTQLHHMISERRRREKLNESFQVLRSLIPSGSKKDKASVLNSTTEYLSSLKSQVAELSKKNQMLESKLYSVRRSEDSEDQIVGSNSSVDQGVIVEIAQVSSSTSEARFLDLRVNVRGENSMLDLIIRIMELLKQQRNVSLLSVESNTRMLESNPAHGIVMRLKIEGDGFDESGFQEAVKRVVDDQPH